MPELLRTTEDGKDPHYHILYLMDDGIGIASMGGKDPHSHEYVYIEPQEELIDPDPNSPTFNTVLQEGIEGGWFVSPDDTGHEHGLQDYTIKLPTITEKEGDIVVDIAEKYIASRKLEEDSRDAGQEADDFHSHKQWDQDKKRELEAKDRAALTINKLEEKIDNLTGYQKQNRTDFKFLAMENGDEKLCDILNIVVKDLTEKCSYGREESKVFEDAAIVGRGLFNIYDDFERNIQGDIIIERFKWDEGTFGAHEKEDLADCEMSFKEKWYSITKLKEMHPEHAEKFYPEAREKRHKSDEIAEDWDKRLNEKEFVNTVTKQYKVIECQKKVFKRVFILINSDDGFNFDAEGWKTSDINAAKSIPGFHKIPRVSCRMRVTTIASTVLLEDDYLEGPDEDEFSLVPMYAKYRNNEFWGKIEAVKDLQILINKAYSQFADILNKVVSYGWFYDSETFPTKKEAERFKRNSSTAGFVSKLNDASRPPTKIEGVKFPSELANAIAMFNQDMREIMNINLDMQGMGAGDSGVAIKQKIVQQLIGNDFLFDNLSFTKKKLGQIILKKIAKNYTPERILRIVANQHTRAEDGLTINGKPFDEMDQEAMTRMLESADLTQYDVIVSESSSSPSAMMGNFLALLELAGRGVPIPPEAILAYAPIPDKKKVMEALAQSQQREAEAEDKKYNTEIIKSLSPEERAAMGGGGQEPGASPGGPPLG